MKNISITFILLLSTLFCFGQSFNTAKLDSLFDLLKEHDKFMGSVELSQNNKVLYARTIGYADLENKHVADQNTKYRIGSISKTFTTALIFIAIESDKLSLDQTIASYFPNVVNADKINIKHLLGHSSGIYNFTNDEDYLDWNTEKQSKEDMIKRISNLESDFEPGSKHDYSNSNFILLTYILEDIYGESYSTLISNMIAKPLGLKNTKFGSTIDIDNNDCHSYYFDGQWVKESETDMSVPVGAGALISTPHDLNLFIEAMFAGDLISKESLAMMMNIEDGYGLGMFKYPYNDKWSYGHGGGIDGFQSMLGYFPEEQLSLSLTSNGVNYKMNDVLLAILGSYFGDGFELPDFNYLEIDETVLDQYIGEYTSDEMPLDITITRESNTLFAQATGQSAFALDATEENVFVFDAAGIRLEFDTSTDKLRMQQGNGDFSYSKKQASAEIEQSKINVYQADDLEQYIGNYKNAKLPFDLLLSVDNNTLVAQATGQSAINLTPTEKHIFTFDPAGIKMEFDPESNNVRLLQNGGNFVFVRE